MATYIREVQSNDTYDDAPLQTRGYTHAPDLLLSKVQQVVYLIFSVLTGLISVRIILSLLGANTNNPFASFIYSATEPFVAPFRGLLGYNLSYGASHLEIESVVAIAAYALLAWIIVRVIELARSRPVHI